MSRAKHTPERNASRSGSYVHEAQRSTVQVKLRLPPDVASSIRSRAAQEEMSISEYIVRLVTLDARIV